MIYQLKKIVVLMAMLLATGTALAACDTSNVSSIAGPQVVSNVQAAIANLNTFHGTVSVEVNSPALQGQMSMTAEVWASKPNLARVVIKSITMPNVDKSVGAPGAEKSMPNLSGATMVLDGSKAWAYTPADNHVYVARIDGQKIANLPTALLTQLQSKIGDLLAQSDIKVVGDALVNGRATTEIQITPKPGATMPGGNATDGMKRAALGMLLSNSRLTLWLDKAINLPVQVEFDTALGKATITTSGDEFNQPIPASVFTFTPPAGAIITTIDPSKTEPKLLDSAGKDK